MFTGIIEAMGSVGRVTRKGADALLGIETAMDLQEVRVGDSIAVNGACLTVTARGDRGFTADVSAETLERTNLRMLKTGDRVNLEKAMRLNDFLGGHLVLGHVDGLGRVQEITRKANSLIFGIETDAKLLRYVVEKGSVAVDGISLTVNRCEKKRIYVNLIPRNRHHREVRGAVPSAPRGDGPGFPGRTRILKVKKVQYGCQFHQRGDRRHQERENGHPRR